MSDTNTHAYVATAPCGCVKGLQVDNPNHREDVQRFVNDMMRDGMNVTRLPLADVNGNLDWECAHG